MRAWVAIVELADRWQVSREAIRLRILKDAVETRRGFVPLSVAKRWDSEIRREAGTKMRRLKGILETIEADDIESLSKEMP